MPRKLLSIDTLRLAMLGKYLKKAYLAGQDKYVNIKIVFISTIFGRIVAQSITDK